MDEKANQLYKYHKFNTYLIELLTLNTFHCSTKDKLNDPYDLHFNIKKEFIFNLWNKGDLIVDPDSLFKEYFKVVKLYNGEIDQIEKWTLDDWCKLIFESASNKVEFVNLLIKSYDYKVISFSKQVDKNKEVLMWAHYSGFDGVRLTFEFPEILKGNLLQEINIKKVKYINSRPLISDTEDIIYALYVKNKNWTYENEYRIIKRFYPKLGFDKSYLKEITFGNKMNFQNKITLIRLINKFDYNVKFNDLIVTPNGFSLVETDSNLVANAISDKFYIDEI